MGKPYKGWTRDLFPDAAKALRETRRRVEYQAIVVARAEDTFAFYGPFASECDAEAFAVELMKVHESVDATAHELRDPRHWDGESMFLGGLGTAGYLRERANRPRGRVPA